MSFSFSSNDTIVFSLIHTPLSLSRFHSLVIFSIFFYLYPLFCISFHLFISIYAFLSLSYTPSFPLIYILILIYLLHLLQYNFNFQSTSLPFSSSPSLRLHLFTFGLLYLSMHGLTFEDRVSLIVSLWFQLGRGLPPSWQISHSRF